MNALGGFDLFCIEGWVLKWGFRTQLKLTIKIAPFGISLSFLKSSIY